MAMCHGGAPGHFRLGGAARGRGMRPGRQSERSRQRVVARCARLSLAMIIGLSLLATPTSATVSSHATQGTGRAAKPPRHWDPRILPLVRFVAHARGLSFKHPVPVHFLSDAAFNNESNSTPGSLSKSDRAELAAGAGTLRAIGLAQVDGQTLFNAQNTVNLADTDAFYDSDKKEIFVRGTGLDLSTRVTIAHELTHVLQDQYFDLNRLNDTANNLGNEASDAITSLIEGDAVHIENDYVDSLSQSQQNSYDTTNNQEVAAAESSIPSNVPAILQALSEAPYDVGPTFVQALLDNGDRARLNAAFANPPRTDAEIINPSRYLAGLVAPRLATPRVAVGERRVGTPDSLGAEVLYFMLAARLDSVTALKTADAWAADRYVRFEQAGVQCLRDTFAGRNEADTDALANALAAWTLHGPSGAATTQSSETHVTLRSCDPGAAAVPPNSRILAASTPLATRAALVLQALDGGLKPSTAQCTADRLVADPSVATFLNLDQPTQQQINDFSTKAQNAAGACAGLTS